MNYAITVEGLDQRQPSLLQRAAAIALMVFIVLITARTSLLVTSDDLNWSEEAQVAAAIDVLRERGFTREAFVLQNLTTFRTSDHWWNRYVGHTQAYAATNFPFEIITLYPPFFRVAADDTERAVILLHEAQHLLGSDEKGALVYVWGAKGRLGWTEPRYGVTRVWHNTLEWTQQTAPSLF